MTVVDPETQTGWVPEADEVDDEEEMPLSLRLSIADTLTLGNATCGFMAVYFTTTGILIPHLTGNDESTGMARHSAATAVILMLCAAVFDLFDGLVARKLRSSPMGAELDNLSDLISFGLAAGVLRPRLRHGRRRRAPESGRGRRDRGAAGGGAETGPLLVRDATERHVPGHALPFGALTVVSIVLLELPFAATLMAILGTAWLMVSRVEYPKPRGRLAVAMLAWIVLSMGLLASWAFDAPGGQLLLQTGCALQLVMGAVIPLFATARRVNNFRGNRREARAAQLP